MGKIDVTWKLIPEAAAQVMKRAPSSVAERLYESSGTIEGWDLTEEEVSLVEESFPDDSLHVVEKRKAYERLQEEEQPNEGAVVEALIESLFSPKTTNIADIQDVDTDYVKRAHVIERGATSACIGFRPFDASVRAFSEAVKGSPIEGCWGAVRSHGSIDVWTEAAIGALPAVADTMKRNGFAIVSSNCPGVEVGGAENLDEDSLAIESAKSSDEMRKRDSALFG